MATSVGKVISVPEPTIALMAPAPTPASAIRIMWEIGTRRPYPRWFRCDQTRPPRAITPKSLAALGSALLSYPHIDPDRAAVEAERLAQPTLDEPAVTGLEEPGGEQDECRRPCGGLGAEQDLGLLAPAHRGRCRGDDLLEKGVELPR